VTDSGRDTLISHFAMPLHTIAPKR
jgi:hypothetical protein